jgi:hypothetical protein
LNNSPTKVQAAAENSIRLTSRQILAFASRKGLETFRGVFGIEGLFDERAFAQKSLLHRKLEDAKALL